MAASFYPPNPENVPANLTATTSSYKFKVTLAISGVLLFFLLYFALLAGFAWLSYYFIFLPIELSRIPIMLKIGGIVASLMLFVFALKFLFKLKSGRATNRIKLNASEQAEIFAFVDQICMDTGAPKPANIYLDPDVNAYVAYRFQWLSLIMPVKKELTIGMALIHSLNLSEFKAVVAHEFGHFAQRSMRIGTYVATANTIIHDLIYTRDGWDRALATWRSVDFRLSFAAWIITPFIWLIRQLLGLFYLLLNRLHASLSREMEFNADKVAVSVTGSEAIISALWKLDDSFERWNLTIHYADLLRKQGKSIENLYFHFDQEGARRAFDLNTKYAALEPDPLGGKRFFKGRSHAQVAMYASHPDSDKREDSAKKPFVAAELDTQNALVLFQHAEQLQQQLSAVINKQYLAISKMENASPEDVEAFISTENFNKELTDKYMNNFALRFLHVKSDDEIRTEAAKLSVSVDQLEETLLSELKTIMEPIDLIHEHFETCHQISTGTTSLREISINEKKYTKKNINDAFQSLHQKRVELLENSFKDWDVKLSVWMLLKAKSKGEDALFFKRMEQYRKIHELFKHFNEECAKIYQRYERYSNRNDVESYELTDFSKQIREILKELNNRLDVFLINEFHPLPNLPDRESMMQSLLIGEKFPETTVDFFENNRLGNLFNKFEEFRSGLNRLEQKAVFDLIRSAEN